MHEFAPKNLHPSDGDLAAYIDGALSKEEAAPITEHLASCESCFEVYSETLRFQLDYPGTVVPFPPRQEERRPRPPTFAQRAQPRRWFPLAALLLVGIGTAYLYFLRTPPALETAKVAASIPNRPAVFAEKKGMWFGPRFRGGGGESKEPEIPLDEAAFRTGVQLVNLQVSLKAGKRREAQDAISAILTPLDSPYDTQNLQNEYKALTGSLEDEQKAPAAFLPQATRLVRDTREVFLGDEVSLDLGQWVEAGRLAAAAKDASFFQQVKTRSFLRRLLWREKAGLGEMKLDPVALESLQRIEGIVSKGDDLTDSDYENLRVQLEKILEIYYPKT